MGEQQRQQLERQLTVSDILLCRTTAQQMLDAAAARPPSATRSAGDGAQPAEAGGGATAGEVLEREDALSESAMAAAGGGGGGPDVEGGNIHDGGLPHVSSASGGINNLAQSQSLSVVESYDKKQKLQEEMSLGKS